MQMGKLSGQKQARKEAKGSMVIHDGREDTKSRTGRVSGGLGDSKEEPTFPSPPLITDSNAREGPLLPMVKLKKVLLLLKYVSHKQKKKLDNLNFYNTM